MSRKEPERALPRRAADDNDYKVGPGRPPRHTQFKKGQSGNPGGRKKDAFNLAALLLEEAERPVSIKGSGDSLPAAQAIFRKMVYMALNGNPRAAGDVLDRLERLSGRASISESIVDDPGADDAMVERALSRRPAAPEPADDGGSFGGDDE